MFMAQEETSLTVAEVTFRIQDTKLNSLYQIITELESQMKPDTLLFNS